MQHKPSFADNLKTLPRVDCIARLELYGTGADPDAIIENRPGSSGSIAIYYHLLCKYGGLNVDAAREGLALYGEHTDVARCQPGLHPNIDRLLRIVEEGIGYSVTPVFSS